MTNKPFNDYFQKTYVNYMQDKLITTFNYLILELSKSIFDVSSL